MPPGKWIVEHKARAKVCSTVSLSTVKCLLGYDETNGGCIQEIPACGCDSTKDGPDPEPIGGEYFDATLGACQKCPLGRLQRRGDEPWGQPRRECVDKSRGKVNGQWVLKMDEKCSNPTTCESAYALGYVDTVGASEFKRCPSNSHVPKGANFSNITDCVCVEGYFVDQLANRLAPEDRRQYTGHWNCTCCPDNAHCNGTVGEGGKGQHPW